MKNTSGILLASLLALACGVQAVPLKTDAADSKVIAVFKQMNVPVEAPFKKFSAQIDYDAAKPNLARASMEIDTASLDVGDPDVNKEAAKKEWFNAAQFPKATFVSSGITANGPGKLTVAGKLSIKGRSANVSFPMTVKSTGGKHLFEGTLPIRRLGFLVGEGEWKDTSIVADEILIKFRVSAAQ